MNHIPSSAFGKLAPHIDSSASPTLFFKPQDPGGMSTYRMLLIILRTRQYLIGGRAAIEVIAFTKRHVSKETLLVLRKYQQVAGIRLEILWSPHDRGSTFGKLASLPAGQPPSRPASHPHPASQPATLPASQPASDGLWERLSQ